MRKTFVLGFGVMLVFLLFSSSTYAVTEYIGDIDGFGFPPAQVPGFVGNYQPTQFPTQFAADRDGNGMLDTGDVLPDQYTWTGETVVYTLDLEPNGKTDGWDIFDNRDAGEYEGTNGAEFTDLALTNYFNLEAGQQDPYVLKGDFPGRARRAVFRFDFEVPLPGSPGYGETHLINLLYGDYEVGIMEIYVSNALDPNYDPDSGIPPAAGEKIELEGNLATGLDGSVGMISGNVPWDFLVADEDGDGMVEVFFTVFAPTEPYIAFDFVAMVPGEIEYSGGEPLNIPDASEIFNLLDIPPEIGVAKEVSSVIDNEDGTYTVTYNIVVENLGDVSLFDVQVEEDLATTFAGATSFSVNSLSAVEDSNDFYRDNFTVNEKFDGFDDKNLLAEENILGAGRQGVIQLEVIITPGDNPGPFSNSVMATAREPYPNDDGTYDMTTAEATDGAGVSFPVADLAIEKSDDIDPIVVGNELTYTVTVENLGPADANNVVVTDTLPDGMAFVSTNGCAEDSIDGGVPTCSLGGLPAGESVSYTITVTVDDDTQGTITNTATVDSTTPDPNTANNTANEDTTVNQPQADLSISKADDIDPIVAGNTLTYTLTVNNAGPQTAANVVVTETLPAGVSFVSTNGCVEDASGGGVPECSLGTIAAEDSASYTITVLVDEDTQGTITNTATVTSDTEDPDPSNNAVSEETLVIQADVTIEKSADPTLTVAGDEVTYTVTVTNNGPADAENVVVDDSLPDGVTFVSTDGCIEDDTVGGVPECSLGTLAADASVSYTITVTVDAESGTIMNTVTVSTDTPESNPDNNEASAEILVAAEDEADLSISKADDIDPIVAGNTLTYTLTVNNAGPQTAANVVVTETLPAGVSFVSTNGCVEDASGGGVPECSLGTIAAEDSASYTITVLVDEDTQGTITNTATVTSDTEDPDLSNNAVSEETLVIQADVTIEKSADPTLTVAGDEVTYTVTVTNNGPADAENVVVDDSLPDGVTFVSTDGCIEDDTVGGVPECSLGTLAADASVSYTITVTVDAESGTIMNTVTVSTDTPESNPDNNEASAEILVAAEDEADLEIAKSDDVDPVVAGDLLTYTVTVTNNGPADALDVVVTDTLPDGVLFGSTDGCLTEDPGGNPTCSLGAIAAGDSTSYTITVMVDEDTRGTIINTATVDSATVDPNVDNNSTSEETTVVIDPNGGPGPGPIPTPIPEPGTFLLIGLGLIGILTLRRRQRK